MSRWIFLKFKGAVGHVVEERFVDSVRADLIARGCEFESEAEASGFFLDPGGMVLAGEPREELPPLDGLRIGVLGCAVGGFVTRAERCEVREGGYVKLHSMYSCLCMAPDQRDRLVATLRAVEESAWEKSEAHFERWKEEMTARNAGQQ